MRITSFRIKNFRNLRSIECSEVPDFMVICGRNGSGKSALLEALMIAKDRASAYGNLQFDPSVVSADALKSEISLSMSFSDKDCFFAKDQFAVECPNTADVVIEIDKSGTSRVLSTPRHAKLLLSYCSDAMSFPGFFDYLTFRQQAAKADPEPRSTERPIKFDPIAQYLVGLRTQESFQEMVELLDYFLTPIKCTAPDLHKTSAQVSISTPNGDVSIDALSSGEKEMLHSLLRLHQLRTKEGIILVDGADANIDYHLHRRYLKVLKQLGKGSQLFVTTRSPAMMGVAGPKSLYTLLKELPYRGGNQLVQVTAKEQLIEPLSQTIWSKGIGVLQQCVVFVESEEAEADCDLLETIYHPNRYNVAFVPAGCLSPQDVAEQVNHLLATTSPGYHQYFSIILGDAERMAPDLTSGQKLFRLPVRHADNLLLQDAELLEVTRQMLGPNCPYDKAEQVAEDLQRIVISKRHSEAYAKSIFQARILRLADTAIQSNTAPAALPDYSEVREEVSKLLKAALQDGSWRAQCRGREVLRTYCDQHGLTYDSFRAALISRMMKNPPLPLAEVMSCIIQG